MSEERLSKHFVRSEFACKCGNCNHIAVDSELLEVLEECIQHFELEYDQYLPAIINSGNRCKTHNENIGGSANSMHLYSIAADFRIKGVDADDVADYLEECYPGKYGIGRYNGRTHIDVRPNKARWDSR